MAGNAAIFFNTESSPG